MMENKDFPCEKSIFKIIQTVNQIFLHENDNFQQKIRLFLQPHSSLLHTLIQPSMQGVSAWKLSRYFKIEIILNIIFI